MKTMELKTEEKVVENEGVDRISDLPDPILEQIISYLPTKNAFATSILSKRWKKLSPFAFEPIGLDLDDTMLLHPPVENESDSDSASTSFVDFVDKLLNQTLYDVPYYLVTMLLRCENDYSDAKIVSWVSAALRHNVLALGLEFSMKESEILFAGLHGCTTLVLLVLALDDCELYLPDNFNLPNVITVHLMGLTLKLNYEEGEDFVGDLIKGCPALKDLWMKDCNLSDLRFLDIESPQLKKLTIEGCFEENICEFYLCAPNLEELVLNDYVAWRYTPSKLTSLLLAHINVGPSEKQMEEGHDEYHYDSDDGCWRFDNGIAVLITACSDTTTLYLAASSISALCHSSLQLPKFQNLTWLRLGWIGQAVLAHLLQNAPNLERLTIDEGFEEDKGRFANFEKWPADPPVCLELQVKRIEFRKFRGLDEIDSIGYFLKNGRVLQKLILDCLQPDNNYILIRLLMLPRQSKTCQVICRRPE